MPVLVISFFLHNNSQIIGRPDKQKAAKDSRFLGLNKQIPWNKPISGAMNFSRKLQLLESD